MEAKQILYKSKKKGGKNVRAQHGLGRERKKSPHAGQGLPREEDRGLPQGRQGLGRGPATGKWRIRSETGLRAAGEGGQGRTGKSCRRRAKDLYYY